MSAAFPRSTGATAEGMLARRVAPDARSLRGGGTLAEGKGLALGVA